MQAIVVAQGSDAPRLVEGKPVLHPVSKCLEAEFSVVWKRLPSWVQYTVVSVTRLNELKFDIPVPSLKFLHNLWAKPAKVLLMECQWEIIVVEVCIWGDSWHSNRSVVFFLEKKMAKNPFFRNHKPVIWHKDCFLYKVISQAGWKIYLAESCNLWACCSNPLLPGSPYQFHLNFIQSSALRIPVTQENSKNLAHLLGKILDQEIENRYASKPMFFIMFTSSYTSKSIHQTSEIQNTYTAYDTPCIDDTRRPTHQPWHC